jgi:RNA polymerase sigma factor for flagellar operon FliA
MRNKSKNEGTFSAPDTIDLWRRYKEEGDTSARDALITRYAYLVKITAGRVVTSLPPNVERDDLISAGVVGLIKAVDQYDTSRKVKFETYAIALIRGAILEMLREEDWVPRSVRERVKALEKAYLRLEMSLGRPATEEEVAEELGITVDELHSLLIDTGRATLMSLDDVIVGADGNERIHLSDVINDQCASPSMEIESKEIRRMLAEAIDRLPEREALVISLYYYEGLTFKEIGKVLSVSESRVYQLHTQAILRLRGYLSQNMALFH